MPDLDPLEELKERRQIALAMGGPEKVARQQQRGKKTVRERIAALVDSDSFDEIGQLASHHGAPGRAQSLDEITAADGVVVGLARIDGRPACIVGEDFTIMGGSYGIVHGRKKQRAAFIAYRERLPIVWLLDGAGARAQDMIGEGLPAAPHYAVMARHSGRAPQVAVVMGPSAGESSLAASQCEFIIMVDKISMLAAGGPPVVKAATGTDVTKEELGGTQVHCRESGLADNIAVDEEAALLQARCFLSYLPNNAWAYPPHWPTDDPVERREEALLNILPKDSRQPYDMKKVIDLVVDRESFFEIKPEHATMMITGFARMDGHPVGIVANQPLVLAGAISAKAAHKARHFIDLCSAYHVPLVFLMDVPGVMPGVQSEREGTLRPGLALNYSIAWADVPKVTVILRKAFGYGAMAMGGGEAAGNIAILAWPDADFGSLPPSSAVLAAHSAELDAAEDRDALFEELMENYRQCSGAFHAAITFSVDDVIDPRETRPRIIRALSFARNRRHEPPEPVARYGVMP